MYITGKVNIDIKAFSGFLFLILLFAIVSCEKEKLYTDPVIEVMLPTPMKVYGLGDTIPVHVIIRHKLKLESVNVTLGSTNGIPYEPTKHFNVDSNYFELKTYIVIQNVLIKGGVNYVQISTHDENHHNSSFYVPVTIAEVPRQLKSAVFFVKHINQINDISSLSPSGVSRGLFLISGPVSADLAVTSSNQTLYLVGSNGLSFSAFDLESEDRKWILNEPVSPVQSPFQSLYSDDTIAYVYKGQGFINGYNSNQLVVFHTEKFEHGSFTHITRFGRFVAAGFKPFNTGLTRLYLFNSPGGTVYREISFKGEVMYLSAYDNNRMILFLKQEGKIKIYHYDINLNNLVFSMELPFGEAGEITGTGKGHYFVIHQEELWWIRPEINSAVNYLQRPGLSNVAYDSLGNYLFIAADGSVCLYQLPDMVPLFEYSTGGEVTGIELLYNR